MGPKFSVVLPVRNGWPYVQECVRSILAQTYTDWELLVLDNCSSDQMVAWLATIKDPRIRLYTSPASLDIVASWNRIKDIPKQQYMTIIGHDDIFDRDFLEIINSLVEANPSAGIYQTGARYINSEGKTIRTCRPVPKSETAAEYLEARFRALRDISASGYVMRSADYDKLGGIPSFEKLYFSDDALWLSLMKGANKVNEPSQHLSIRIHAKSESASVPSLWPSILIGLNQFAEFLARFDDPDSQAMVLHHQGRFMLNYHINIYIYALIEASAEGRKVDQSAINKIEESLARVAPSQSGKLGRSPKVAMIKALNSSPVRFLVPPLWTAFYALKTARFLSVAD